jgi:IS5 family transposase
VPIRPRSGWAGDDRGVQGRSEAQRDLLDVESVAGHLLAPGSVFAFLAEHRTRLFPDAMFADLFARGGRPSVPADVMAAVIVLQSLHGLSDVETVEALTFDLRWKAACGLPVTAAAFHSTSLTYWRRRLAASSAPERIFEAVRTVVAETGILKGKHRRALDSTVLNDAVATQDTVTQLVAAIRRVLREVPGAVEVAAVHCTAHDYSRPGKPAITWDDHAARVELIDALVGDAHRLLGHLPEVEHGPKAAEALALLALVAGQDVEPVDGSDGTDGHWRIAQGVAPDRVISTVDVEARHAHKTVTHRQDGFKAHIVVEPDTGIITAAELTGASGADTADGRVGIDLLGADASIAGPVQVLGDSAYATGQMLATLAAAEHHPLVKPWAQRPAVPGGFELDDFELDPEASTLTCPNQVTRTITAKGTVTFGAACRGCPLRARCTTSSRGRKVLLGEHHHLQREHRARAKDPDWQGDYRRHRPMVERTIAWLTTGGNRKVRYRGTIKNNAWLHHRTAALNLRRLLVLGLTRTDGTWVVA